MKAMYTARSTSKGGRNGSVKSNDGKIDMNLNVPKGMGGEGGEGTNPEQLFASAFAACYGSALQAVAKSKEIDMGDFSVTANVKIGKNENDDFQLAVVMDSYIPGADQETGEMLVNKAHEVCPYSRATRDNIDVTLNLLMDE